MDKIYAVRAKRRRGDGGETCEKLPNMRRKEERR